jgi:hypothetical protein
VIRRPSIPDVLPRLRKGQEEYPGGPYVVAFATMTLFVPEGRLSIYNRIPPKLPKE